MNSIHPRPDHRQIRPALRCKRRLRRRVTSRATQLAHQHRPRDFLHARTLQSANRRRLCRSRSSGMAAKDRGERKKAGDGLLHGVRMCAVTSAAANAERMRAAIRPNEVSGFLVFTALLSYSTTTTGAPSTSIFGAMPRPGAAFADMKPSTRRGAPSAVGTVT